MKRQTLKQRRSLAAQRGWQTRRKKKLDASWAAVAEKAKTAPVVPCPEQTPEPDVSFDAYRGRTDPERLDLVAEIDLAHREREAQSKHPGSPDYATKARELAEYHRSFLGRWPDWYVREFPDATWREESAQVIAEHSLPEAQKHNALLQDEMGAKSEARSELLLTEGMRVKEKIWSRIRMLADRFVKALRGKA